MPTRQTLSLSLIIRGINKQNIKIYLGQRAFIMFAVFITLITFLVMGQESESADEPETTKESVLEGSKLIRGGEAKKEDIVGSDVTVIPSGALSYTKAIEIPTGRNGMQPKLSIVYNSNSGNGILGMGFSLRGLPAIVRIPFDCGIHFNGNDHFAVASGWGTPPDPTSRLVRSSNEPIYKKLGNSGTNVYEAVSCGSDEPCYWVQRDGNGNIYYFGGDESNNASNIAIPQKFHATVWEGDHGVTKYRGIYAWLLYKVVDAYGNSYEVEYDNRTDERYPLKVQYTLPAAQYVHEIVFSCEDRDDIVAAPYFFNKRIKDIEVISQDQTVRLYHFEYEESPVSGRSRIKEIQVFGEENDLPLQPTEKNDHHLQPTRFIWANGRDENNTTPEIMFDPVQSYEIQAQSFEIPQEVQFPDDRLEEMKWDVKVVGDINGDGRNDVILTTKFYRIMFYALASPSGGFEVPRLVTFPYPNDSTVRHRGFYPCDINGDGKQDVVIVSKVEESIFEVSDWYLDVMLGSAEGLQQQKIRYLENAKGTKASNVQITDINGDQKIDFIFYNSDEIAYVYGNDDIYDNAALYYKSPYKVPAQLHWKLTKFMTADVNGDGRGDLVLVSGYGASSCENRPGRLQQIVMLGRKQGLSRPQEVLNDFMPIGRGTYNVNFLFGDLNGDSKGDITLYYLGYKTPAPGVIAPEYPFNCDGNFASVQIGTFFNNYSEFTWNEDDFSGEYISHFVYTEPFIPTQGAMADFNGDGISDLFNIHELEIVISLGKKDGTLSPKEKRLIPYQLTEEQKRDFKDLRLFYNYTLGDINGDGLTDVMICADKGTRLLYALGHSDDVIGEFNSLSLPELNVYGYKQDPGILAGDFNGDGIDDILLAPGHTPKPEWLPNGRLGLYRYEDRSDTFHYLLSASGPTDIIVEIENGYGGKYEIEYGSAADYGQGTPLAAIRNDALGCTTSQKSPGDCDGVPDITPRWLVEELHRIDTHSSALDTHTVYQYSNGRVRRGLQEDRQNLGFEEIRATNADTGVVRQTIFYQNGVLAGYPENESIWLRTDPYSYELSGRMYTKYNSYEKLIDVDDNWNVVLDHENIIEFEDDVTTSSREIYYQYDEYFNITEKSETIWGNSPLNITTTNSYGDNYGRQIPLDIGRGIFLDHRLRSTITQTEEGMILNKERFTYHDFKPMNLRTHERFLFDDLSNTSSANSGHWVTIQDHIIHDQYGNVKSFVDTNGNVTEMGYDTQKNTYPTWVRNPANQLSETEYDYAGRTIATIAPYRTEFIRDNLGRLEELWSPDVGEQIGEDTYTGPGRHKTWSYPDHGDVNNQRNVERIWRLPDVHYDVHRYFNGFGQVYRTVRESETGTIESFRNEYWGHEEGIGRVIEYSSPEFTLDSPHWIRIEHDSMDRPIRVSQITNDGSVQRVLETYEYRPGIVVGLDANQNKTTRYYDERGRLWQIEDADGNMTIYHYNDADLVTRVDLPNGDYEEYGFDGWRRQILHRQDSSNHPVSGEQVTKYDDSGNIIETIDNKKRSILMTYDMIGRLTSVVPDNGEECISYVYDTWNLTEVYQSARCVTAPGKKSTGGDLKTDITPLFHKEWNNIPKTWSIAMEYDRRNNIISKTEKRADIRNRSFISTYNYDYEDNLIAVTFPDGSLKELGYTNDGMLKEVNLFDSNSMTGSKQSFVSYSEFDSRGRPRLKLLPDGTETVYSYDDYARLQRIETTSSRGLKLQDNEYEYDPAGNVTAIQDHRPEKIQNRINTDITQSFEYDVLHRLVQATGAAYGTLQYDYDEAGFLIDKEDMTYTYSVRRGLFGNDSPYTRCINGQRSNSNMPNNTGGKFGISISTDVQNRLRDKLTSGPSNWDAYYDSLGNRVGWSENIPGTQDSISWEYEYNISSRLVRADRTRHNGSGSFRNTASATFAYDHTGKRIKKTVEDIGQNAFNPLTTHYFMDGLYEVRGYKGDPVTSETKYITGFDGPVASVTKEFRSGEYINLISNDSDISENQFLPLTGDTILGLPEGTFWFHRNHLGSVEVVTDLRFEKLTKPDTPKVPKGVNIYDTGSVKVVKNPNVKITKVDKSKVSTKWDTIAGKTSKVNNTLINKPNNYTTTNFTKNSIPEGPIIAYDLFARERSRYLYKPFGELIRSHSTGYDLSTRKFTGQEDDELTGLLYYSARYYDPLTGQFLTPDIIVPGGGTNPQGFNHYAYVLNNPLKYIDPTGFDPISFLDEGLSCGLCSEPSTMNNEVNSALNLSYELSSNYSSSSGTDPFSSRLSTSDILSAGQNAISFLDAAPTGFLGFAGAATQAGWTSPWFSTYAGTAGELAIPVATAASFGFNFVNMGLIVARAGLEPESLTLMDSLSFTGSALVTGGNLIEWGGILFGSELLGGAAGATAIGAGVGLGPIAAAIGSGLGIGLGIGTGIDYISPRYPTTFVQTPSGTWKAVPKVNFDFDALTIPGL